MINGAPLVDWGTRTVFVRTVAVAHKVFIRHAKHIAEVKVRIRTCSCLGYPHGFWQFILDFNTVLTNDPNGSNFGIFKIFGLKRIASQVKAVTGNHILRILKSTWRICGVIWVRACHQGVTSRGWQWNL